MLLFMYESPKFNKTIKSIPFSKPAVEFGDSATRLIRGFLYKGIAMTKTKICSKCNKEKYLKEFSKRKDSKDGYRGYCKECELKNKKNYYKENRELILEQKEAYYRSKNPVIIKEVLQNGLKRCNKCKLVKNVSEFRKKKNGLLGCGAVCKTCVNSEQRENPRTEYNKEYRLKNRDNLLRYEKDYRKNNRVLLKNKRANNRPKLREYTKLYIAERKKRDPSFKLSITLRLRIITAIKNQYTKKAFSSMELLGCTIKEARDHLEKQFTDGMTWNNHGLKGWHIDHIKPCASFDLTDPEQQKECFHYTNLQPLWAEDNLKKGAKIV